jgi:hypothetical protein
MRPSCSLSRFSPFIETTTLGPNGGLIMTNNSTVNCSIDPTRTYYIYVGLICPSNGSTSSEGLPTYYFLETDGCYFNLTMTYPQACMQSFIHCMFTSYSPLPSTSFFSFLFLTVHFSFSLLHYPYYFAPRSHARCYLGDTSRDYVERRLGRA